MFKRVTYLCSLLLAVPSTASHLDDTNGLFSNFKFDVVKFKTQTNCSLDKYPEVRYRQMMIDCEFVDEGLARL